MERRATWSVARHFCDGYVSCYLPPGPELVWSPRWDVPLWSRLWMLVLKLDSLSYPIAKTEWYYGCEFWLNIIVWRTDEQTRCLYLCHTSDKNEQAGSCAMCYMFCQSVRRDGKQCSTLGSPAGQRMRQWVISRLVYNSASQCRVV